MFFVIDMSHVTEKEQQFLIKDRLLETITDLSSSNRYVVFFSGPAWRIFDDVGLERSKWTKGKDIMITVLMKNYQKVNGVAWWQTVGEVKGYLDELKTTGGTDWRHPFDIAYAMNPKPNVIFFDRW